MSTDTTNTFDVYVSENAMMEVHRGPHMTVMQTFGEDWTSAPLVQIHPHSPKQRTGTPVFAPRESRSLQVKPGISWSWGIVVAILASLCAWGLVALFARW
jgi:hypothetical protein